MTHVNSVLRKVDFQVGHAAGEKAHLEIAFVFWNQHNSQAQTCTSLAHTRRILCRRYNKRKIVDGDKRAFADSEWK